MLAGLIVTILAAIGLARVVRLAWLYSRKLLATVGRGLARLDPSADIPAILNRFAKSKGR